MSTNPFSGHAEQDSETPDTQAAIGPLLARLDQLEQLEHSHRQTLEHLYLHQEELRMQNDELRHAQASLEHARRRHQELFDFSPVAQFLVTPNGMILKTNRVAGELLGLAHHDLFNFHMPNLAGNHHHRAAILNFLETIKLNRQTAPISVDLFRKNGQSICVQLHGSRSSNNQETSILVTAVDHQHSSLLQAERQQHKQTQTLLSAVFELSPQALFVTNSAWRIQRINSALTRESGFTLGDLFDQVIEQLIQADDEHANQAWLALKQQRQWQGRVRLKTREASRPQPSMQLTLQRLEETPGQTEGYLGLLSHHL